jgi:hypothetical protein
MKLEETPTTCCNCLFYESEYDFDGNCRLSQRTVEEKETYCPKTGKDRVPDWCRLREGPVTVVVTLKKTD